MQGVLLLRPLRTLGVVFPREVRIFGFWPDSMGRPGHWSGLILYLHTLYWARCTRRASFTLKKRVRLSSRTLNSEDFSWAVRTGLSSPSSVGTVAGSTLAGSAGGDRAATSASSLRTVATTSALLSPLSLLAASLSNVHSSWENANDEVTSTESDAHASS